MALCGQGRFQVQHDLNNRTGEVEDEKFIMPFQIIEGVM